MMTCKTKEQFFIERFGDNVAPNDLPEAVQMGMNAFGLGMTLKLAGMGVNGARFAMYNDVKLAVASGAVGGGTQYGGMSASYVGAAAGLGTSLALGALGGAAAATFWPALAIMAVGHIVGSAAQAYYQTEWQYDQPTGPGGCPFPENAPLPPDPHGNPNGGDPSGGGHAGSSGGGAFVPSSNSPLNPRWDPLVIDLLGDGLDFISVDGSTVQFDLNGDGFRETAGWIGAGTGLVIRDLNGNGLVDNAGELIGNAKHHAYEVLQELDDNNDGVIDADDAVFGELRVWQDLDQDGVTDPGELKTLTELGIERFSVNGVASGIDIDGNLLAFTGTAGGAGSTTFQTGAVYFATDMLLSEWQAPSGFTINTDVYGLPNLAGYGLVKDLDAAMSLDATLLEMVEQLVLSSDALTPNALRQGFEAILLRWAGVETIDPESRGDWIDARRLAVVEAFFGQGFFTTDGTDSTTDPMIDQVDPINMTYDNIVEVMLTRFVTQMAASRLVLTNDNDSFISSPYLALAAAGYNAESDMLEGNLRPTMMLLKQFAPTSGVEQIDYLGMALSTFRGAEGEYLGYRDGYDGILSDVFGDPDSIFLSEFALAVHAADGVMGRSEGVGRDVLWAHASGELLDGGGGDDTYVYVGGEIIVREAITYGSAVDQILIDPAFSAASVTVERSGDDVILSFAQGGAIRLIGQDGASDGGVEKIVFADGEVWSRADLRAAYFDAVGTSGADVISGFYRSNDVLDGGAGNDTLSGRSGIDTFIFGRGYGSDLIAEIHQAYHGVLNIDTGDDVVAFNSDIGLGDLRVHVVGSDLVLTVEGAADVLTIWRGASGDDWYRVEGFSFAAEGYVSLGTLLTLAEPVTQRVIASSAPAVVDLSPGDERVTGRYDVVETYTYARGDGFDVLNSEGLGGGEEASDFVSFTDIASTDVRFLRSGDNWEDLVIEISGIDGGRLVIRDQFGRGPTNGAVGISGISFSDNVTLSLDEIVERMLQDGVSDGADILRGGVGADRLEGGGGDDEMRGGRGSDTYVWAAGDGHDVIIDSSPRMELGVDTLVLRDVDPSAVRVERGVAFGGPSGSLRLSFDGQDGSILIHDQSNGALERILFDNGTVWDAAELSLRASGGFGEAVTRAGTSGDDILIGSSGNDVFEGGGGDDRMEGGAGSDLYRFGAGDGHDVIDDDGGHPTEGADGIDLLGLSPEDVVLGRSDDHLFIRIIATGETLTVLNHFSTWDADTSTWSIERLIFASGETWDLDRINLEGDIYRGTDGSDYITAYGGGDNVFIGHGGDDVLRDWYGGDDTYIWSPGDGNDQIREANGFDTVRLKGVNPADVVLARSNDDLTITMVLTGEVVTVYRHFDAWDSQYAIERILFDDSEWDAGYIQAHVPLVGTPDNDYLYGGDADETLVGGLGDDVLNGGGGSDTYQYAAGDGSDEVQEGSGELNDSDVLHLADLTPDDVVILADEGGDVLLHLPDGSVITLQNQWQAFRNDAPGVGVEEIRFADGQVWSRTQIIEAAFSSGAVEARFGGGGDDILVGGAGTQVIQGLGGDDLLSGGAGDDRLLGGDGQDDMSGGTGTDILQGGEQGDTYRFDRGDGADVIADNGMYGTDTLILGPGLTAQDVSVVRDGEAFILDFGQGDSVRLEFALHGLPGAGIDQIRFADNTVWTREDLAALSLAQAATAGDDAVEGFATDDDIAGGAGQDWLYGGLGDDTYHFNLGDGEDTIQDDGGVDRIILGAGIDPLAVTVSRGFNGEVVLELGGGDRLIIQNGLLGADGAFQDDYGVETIEFANAVVWTKADLATRLLASTSGHDQIAGFTTNDILTGGGGRDLFVASGGVDLITDFSVIDDRIAFDRSLYATAADVLAAAVQVGSDVVIGVGPDTLTIANVVLGDLTADHIMISGYDDAGRPDAYAYELGWGDLVLNEDALGGLDSLTFGAGISPAGIQVTREGAAAVLRFADGAVLRLEQQFAEWAWGEGAGIEQIRFADNTVWTREDLAALSLAQAATAGDDAVEGFATDDDIAGGAGQDWLYGGLGDDTYHFNLGDGEDTIQDDGGVDRIILGAGIDPLAVTVSRGFNGEVVLELGGGDRLIIQNGLLGADGAFQDDYGVETIEFANAVVWTKADLATRLLASTSGHDQIAGFTTNDILTGGGGRDLFVASGGVDLITDFSVIDDRIAFDRSLYATAADVLAAAVQVGSDVVIGVGPDTLTIANVVLGDLTADHIMISGYDDAGRPDAYAYELGWGDLVLNEDALGGLDSLTFGAGVTASSLKIEQDETTAVITLQDGAQMRIVGQFADWAWSDGFGVESFNFADGATWTRDDLVSAYLAGQATAGDDIIKGFNRDDVLSGGGGRDIFDFTSTWLGDDVITDFDVENDSLLFADYRFGDGFDVLRAARQEGSDVVIRFGDDASVTLQGVSLGDLGLGNLQVQDPRDWSEPPEEPSGGSEPALIARGAPGVTESLFAFDVFATTTEQPMTKVWMNEDTDYKTGAVLWRLALPDGGFKTSLQRVPEIVLENEDLPALSWLESSDAFLVGDFNRESLVQTAMGDHDTYGHIAGIQVSEWRSFLPISIDFLPLEESPAVRIDHDWVF